MQRWDHLPSLHSFSREYFEPMEELLRPMLEDWGIDSAPAFHRELLGLNWERYRGEVLGGEFRGEFGGLDPMREEARVRRHIEGVERLLGVTLSGETVLFGAFTMMDGYARFERGVHRVFLGVDESHGRGQYLDVLMAHELTHVARETQASVWEGYGLNPRMTHDEFSENLPTIEHLFNEGFACAVSEILVPGEDPWHYAYQEEDSLARVLQHGPAVDRVIHAELSSPDGGDWGRFYRSSLYRPEMPLFCHYVWAWKWAKSLISREGGGDPSKLLSRCAGEWVQDALVFRLS